MTLMKCKGRLYYFAHIPKTGGSSVEFALREAGAKRALHYHKRMDYLRCNLQHMHAELFDTFIPPPFYHRGFCVVRHPVARLVSEYYWRQSLGHVNQNFDKWVRVQLTAYEKDPYILDNHMRPQHEFIGKKIEVFKFEDGIPTILEAISKMTKLTLDTGTHKRKGGDKAALTWSPETRLQALNFYEQDFETFGYDYNTAPPQLTIVR